MEIFNDRRLFRRYKHKSYFYIIIEGESYKASTVDFSLGGLCIFIEDIKSLQMDSVIDIKIEDMDLDIQARVVWTKKSEKNLIVGFEKLSITGLLRFYPLPDMLFDLQKSDVTGVLEFKDGPVQKKIFIKNGVMVFATSNHEEDRLEEILLRNKKMTTDQYYQLKSIMEKEKKPVGRILVEQNFIKPNELVLAVKNQAEEIILSLFRWESGVIS